MLINEDDDERKKNFIFINIKRRGMVAVEKDHLISICFPFRFFFARHAFRHKTFVELKKKEEMKIKESKL